MDQQEQSVLNNLGQSAVLTNVGQDAVQPAGADLTERTVFSSNMGHYMNLKDSTTKPEGNGLVEKVALQKIKSGGFKMDHPYLINGENSNMPSNIEEPYVSKIKT